MGLLEEILKNKEELLVKFLEILEGKEASARIDLSDVKFKLGHMTIELDGEVRFTLMPKKKKK